MGHFWIECRVLIVGKKGQPVKEEIIENSEEDSSNKSVSNKSVSNAPPPEREIKLITEDERLMHPKDLADVAEHWE